jgi:hypothetical protein
MKSQNANQRNTGAGRRTSPIRIPNIPMEWMDPMSWRLPSGKALAEFALQAGFLAPLMLGMPRMKKRHPAAQTGKVEAVTAPVEKPAGEEPEHSGRFRAGGFTTEGCGPSGFRADGFEQR